MWTLLWGHCSLGMWCWCSAWGGPLGANWFGLCPHLWLVSLMPIILAWAKPSLGLLLILGMLPPLPLTSFGSSWWIISYLSGSQFRAWVGSPTSSGLHAQHFSLMFGFKMCVQVYGTNFSALLIRLKPRTRGIENHSGAEFLALSSWNDPCHLVSEHTQWVKKWLYTWYV